MRQINFYAINPKQLPRPFPIPIKIEQARTLNDNGQDIYWTFNEFSGFGKRTKADLKKIWCFYCEVDGIDKHQISEKLKRNLPPSLIIESRNGFHLYWYLKEPIDCSDDPVKWADWFHAFVKSRFLHIFNADPQACDACRLLRAPFYKYWKRQKDGTYPDGSFHSDIVFDNEEAKYTLSQLEKFFPEKKEKQSKFEDVKINYKPFADNGNFWNKANNLPVLESLKLLSGTGHINNERLSFKKEKHNVRIYVNDKPSNAWIDRDGKIGSTAQAGPSVPNWLYFYHHDWKKVVAILKEVFNVS